jgi:predicted glycosyltransferase involved in capsule biosynthesis
MKLSIILPIGGVYKNQNFCECLYWIKKQTFTDYEIIIVEQNMDGSYYYGGMGYQWYGIRDIENRGYNLSWGRNKGVIEAKGDIVVLMDVDLIFNQNYFELISQMKTVFAAGAEYYIWGSQQITERYFQCKDINVFNENVHKLRSFGKIYGFGTCLCFNREWFLDVFGGYNESFAGWGWEDVSAAWRIEALLNKTDEEIERIPTEIIHLFHTHDISASVKNRQIFDDLKQKYNPVELCNKIRITGRGRNIPSLI